jgi:protein-tyrosine phosphatase
MGHLHSLPGAKGTSVKRPWIAAFIWLAVLTPFFFLTYGYANTHASQRTGVPSIVFAWEHRIPFLAWTIVPYWTSDLLYGFSLLVCRSRKELNRQVMRLIMVQLISIAAFLAFPLTFTFDRPQTSGFFGWLFDVLLGFDKPFNQAPSLHVSLATILCVKLCHHLPRPARWVMRAWCVLVALSTLTTYQHHFIDIPTGLWVGLLCLVLVPEESAQRSPANSKLALTYATGGLAFAANAAYFQGLAWLLLWPAGALLVVALIYATGRTEWFGKTNGIIRPAAQWLLAPYLIAARINSHLWTRNRPAAREIAGGVWLGRVPGPAEIHYASVVDLTAELSIDASKVKYRNIPVLDLTVPTAEQIEAAVTAINEMPKPLLVCCALGVSRSATAVAAWLLASGHASTVDGAIKIIESRQAPTVLSESHRKLLQGHGARA